ncbi:MAG: hypothetical protein K9N55_11500 [Phycisphaerae bacterium]|nr:hypothetical protein [Phycisphaerae bacterium]
MAAQLLLTFLTPERIGVTPFSILWALPLIASISIVYKATKVYAIKPKAFAKETAGLFGSIVAFLLVAALILCGIAWLFNEKMAILAG